MAGEEIDGVRERGVRRAVLGVVHGGWGERRGRRRQRCVRWPCRRCRRRRRQPKPRAQPPHMHIKPTLPRMRQEDLKAISYRFRRRECMKKNIIFKNSTIDPTCKIKINMIQNYRLTGERTYSILRFCGANSFASHQCLCKSSCCCCCCCCNCAPCSPASPYAK